MAEATLGLGRHFDFYNFELLNQELDCRTPTEVYGDDFTKKFSDFDIDFGERLT